MRPILFTVGGLEVPTYAVALSLAFAAALWVRRAEKRRTGWSGDPRGRVIGMVALIGAAIGAKLGMVLFEPWGDFTSTLRRVLSLDFSGKTVVGGIIGGYLAIELAKKLMGLRRSTGDSFALALPLAQAIGRVGCFFHGCCYGAPSGLPWAVEMHGARRHPAQLYEAGLDLGLFFAVLALRGRFVVEGNLFKAYLVGYALVRFALDFLRGDPVATLGPLTAVQWIALAAIAGFSTWIARSEARAVSEQREREREGEGQAADEPPVAPS